MQISAAKKVWISRWIPLLCSTFVEYTHVQGRSSLSHVSFSMLICDTLSTRVNGIIFALFNIHSGGDEILVPLALCNLLLLSFWTDVLLLLLSLWFIIVIGIIVRKCINNERKVLESMRNKKHTKDLSKLWIIVVKNSPNAYKNCFIRKKLSKLLKKLRADEERYFVGMERGCWHTKGLKSRLCYYCSKRRSKLKKSHKNVQLILWWYQTAAKYIKFRIRKMVNDWWNTCQNMKT